MRIPDGNFKVSLGLYTDGKSNATGAITEFSTNKRVHHFIRAAVALGLVYFAQHAPETDTSKDYPELTLPEQQAHQVFVPSFHNTTAPDSAILSEEQLRKGFTGESSFAVTMLSFM